VTREPSNSVPDVWPPVEDERTPQVIPLFPLPRVWLFPYVVLPLHVFEDRYRQMIEDSLDGPGRIVLGTIREGHEEDLEGSPPFYPIAGLGEIGRHQRLPDGRFHVWLVGLQRVRIEEIESDRKYRKVKVHLAPEIPVPNEREEELRHRLVNAILERTEKLSAIPPQVSISHLADLLILRTPLPQEVLNTLYSELDSEKRALQALDEHAIRPAQEEEGVEDEDEEE
jgi:Lon protease-like protein